MVSCTLAAEGRAASGVPSRATTTGYLVPRFALSVGFGPVSSPPRLARTLQLLTTTSQAAAAAFAPERTIRTRAACTRCYSGPHLGLAGAIQPHIPGALLKRFPFRFS